MTGSDDGTLGGEPGPGATPDVPFRRIVSAPDAPADDAIPGPRPGHYPSAPPPKARPSAGSRASSGRGPSPWPTPPSGAKPPSEPGASPWPKQPSEPVTSPWPKFSVAPAPESSAPGDDHYGVYEINADFSHQRKGQPVGRPRTRASAPPRRWLLHQIGAQAAGFLQRGLLAKLANLLVIPV